jgi:hypothetical protein
MRTLHRHEVIHAYPALGTLVVVQAAGDTVPASELRLVSGSHVTVHLRYLDCTAADHSVSSPGDRRVLSL